MGNLSPLFDWRSAVASRHGPGSPTTRHVLLTLSLWMSVKGDGCYPATRTLAEATGLSRRAVEKHLSLAQDQQWINRDHHGFSGQGWKRYEYAARVPRAVMSAIQQEDRDAQKAGERGSPPTEKGGEPNDDKVGNEVPTNASVESANKPRKKTQSKKATLLPSTWKPSQSHVAKAKALGVNLETETEKFRLHADAVQRKQVKWNSSFAMWLIQSVNFNFNGNGATETQDDFISRERERFAGA